MPRSGDPEFLRQVGSRLFSARTKAGLTQEEAAEKLEMSRAQTLGSWEAGAANFSISDLYAAARLYRVSTDWLLGISEEPRIPANHAIMNRSLERAALAAESHEELLEKAKELDALNQPDSITFGCSLVGDYEIIAQDEYDARIAAIRKRVARLPEKRAKGKQNRRGDGANQ